MTAKPNQGMQRPSLGGIGSRFDVALARPMCSHNDGAWRLKDGGPWRCTTCHPPAVPTSRIETRDAAFTTDERSTA